MGSKTARPGAGPVDARGSRRRSRAQRDLLLLQAKALRSRGPVTLGALAERLQVRHRSAVGLVDRLVRGRMVRRHHDPRDRPTVLAELAPAGVAVLDRLAAHSLKELRTEGPRWSRPSGA